MRTVKVSEILELLAHVHTAKSHDYAQIDNPFSNFEEAAMAAGVPVDTVFAVMMGIKQARLKELQTQGKTPHYESLKDTYIDLALYAVLRATYAHRYYPQWQTPTQECDDYDGA